MGFPTCIQCYRSPSLHDWSNAVTTKTTIVMKTIMMMMMTSVCVKLNADCFECDRKCQDEDEAKASVCLGSVRVVAERYTSGTWSSGMWFAVASNCSQRKDACVLWVQRNAS